MATLWMCGSHFSGLEVTTLTPLGQTDKAVEGKDSAGIPKEDNMDEDRDLDTGKIDGPSSKGPAAPQTCKVQNLSRVLPAQLSSIDFSDSSRFKAVKALPRQPSLKSTKPKTRRLPASTIAGCGIVVVQDSAPTEQISFIDLDATSTTAIETTSGEAVEPIAEMPAPFEWTDWE